MKAFIASLLILITIPCFVNSKFSFEDAHESIKKDFLSGLPKVLSVCSDSHVEETRSRLESMDNVISAKVQSESISCVNVIAYSSAVDEIASHDNLRIESISDIQINSVLGPEDDDYSDGDKYLSMKFYVNNECSGDVFSLLQMVLFGPVKKCLSYDGVYIKILCESDEVVINYYEADDDTCKDVIVSQPYSTSCDTSSSDDGFALSFDYICAKAPSDALYSMVTVDGTHCNGSIETVEYFYDVCITHDDASADFAIHGDNVVARVYNDSTSCSGEYSAQNMTELNFCNVTGSTSTYYAEVDVNPASKIFSSSIGFIVLIATSLMLLFA